MECFNDVSNHIQGLSLAKIMILQLQFEGRQNLNTKKN